MGDIGTESQARALSGLDPDQARDTYARAQHDTGDDSPTADALRRARQPESGSPEPRGMPVQVRDAIAAVNDPGPKPISNEPVTGL